MFGATVDYSLQFHNGLYSKVAESGWEVHVISSPGPNLARLAKLRGVIVHPLSMKRKPSLLSDLVALVRWILILRRIRPDVAFIGTPKAGLLGNAAGLLTGVRRRIYELHGLRLESASGPYRHLLRFLERTAMACSHEVLCVSESLRTLIVDSGLADLAKTHVLGAGSCNGVDCARFASVNVNQLARDNQKREYKLSPDVPVVGFVGRLTRDKGLPELADALKVLHSRGLLLQLLIVGSIDDSSGHAAMARLHNTGHKIVPVGFQAEIKPFYELMDVFCLPSLREGLPGVVLEAMASGVPVVGSNVTGIIDLVEDGVTGFLTDVADPGSLAGAIERAITDRPAANAMAEAAKEFVQRQYDESLVQRNVLDYLVDVR